jgi:hypothetical protein
LTAKGLREDPSFGTLLEDPQFDQFVQRIDAAARSTPN